MIKVLKKYKLVQGNKFISIEPYENDLEINFEIVYKNQLINRQKKTARYKPGCFFYNII